MAPSPFAVKAGSLTACPSCTDVQPATTTADDAKAIAMPQIFRTAHLHNHATDPSPVSQRDLLRRRINISPDPDSSDALHRPIFWADGR